MILLPITGAMWGARHTVCACGGRLPRWGAALTKFVPGTELFPIMTMGAWNPPATGGGRGEDGDTASCWELGGGGKKEKSNAHGLVRGKSDACILLVRVR